MQATIFSRLVRLDFSGQLYIERCCSATDGQGRPHILALYGPFPDALVLDSAGEVKVSLVDLVAHTQPGGHEWLHAAIYKTRRIMVTWEEDPCAASLS